MRLNLALFSVMAAAVLACACSSGGGDGGILDIGGELATSDVPAHEINPFEEKPEEFCKGRNRREQFSLYDYQCEEYLGIGKCVLVEENNYGESFYCAICGLKGAEMVCYMIQESQ